MYSFKFVQHGMFFNAGRSAPRARPNPSIEGTCPGKPGHASSQTLDGEPGAQRCNCSSVCVDFPHTEVHMATNLAL